MNTLIVLVAMSEVYLIWAVVLISTILIGVICYIQHELNDARDALTGIRVVKQDLIDRNIRLLSEINRLANVSLSDRSEITRLSHIINTLSSTTNDEYIVYLELLCDKLSDKSIALTVRLAQVFSWTNCRFKPDEPFWRHRDISYLKEKSLTDNSKFK